MGKIVLDTSIIIDGKIAKQIESDVIKDVEIIIPVAVLDELQSQLTFPDAMQKSNSPKGAGK